MEEFVETNIRKRSVNYLHKEKQILTQLVEKKYRSIIENKCVSTAANVEKQKCWIQIADEFNSLSDHIYRTPANLKVCWENIKRVRKKKLREQNENDSNPVQKVFLVDEPGQPFKFEIISEESLHNIEDISQDGDDMLDNTEDIGSIDQSHDSTLSGNIADSSQQNISIQIAEVKTPVLNVKPISIEEINHDSTNTDKNEGTVSQQNVKKQTIKDTDSQQNVNKQVKPQPMEVKTTNFNPTKTNVKSKLTKLREAQLELVQLKLETARKEQKFMEAEHKMKMRHLDNEERRKQEIHNLVKRKIMLNNIMEL